MTPLLLSLLLLQGAGLRRAVEHPANILDVRDFGALCNDVADDAPAIQAAVDYVGDTSFNGPRSGTVVVIPGPCAIGSTVVVRRKAITIEGRGWGGRADPSPTRSYLRWIGPAGVPMLQVQDAMGVQIRNLRFIGSTSNRPSAALNINDTNDGWPLHADTYENLSMGFGLADGGLDSGPQFDYGILLDGAGINNAEQTFRNIDINGAAIHGVHSGSIQSVNEVFDSLYVGYSPVGVYNAGQMSGTNWGFAGNGSDLETPQVSDQGQSSSGTFYVRNLFSEWSGRLAVLRGNAKLVIDGGSWNGSGANADGRVIDAVNDRRKTVVIRDFQFGRGSSSVPLYLAIKTATPGQWADKTVILENIAGIFDNLLGGTYGLDVQTQSPYERIYVYVSEGPIWHGAQQPFRVARNLLQGAAGLQWDRDRYDVVGTLNLQGPAHSTLNAPANPVNGDWWVECSGTPPSRTCSLMVRDNGETVSVGARPRFCRPGVH